MYEIEASECDEVRPLFADIGHSRAFAFSVFEGNHVGRVLVDDLQLPLTAVVACQCEFTFLAGDAGNERFNQALKAHFLSELAPQGGHLFLFPGSDAWQGALDGLFGEYRRLQIVRKTFDLDRDLFDRHRSWRERIPDGFRVERYDERRVRADGGLVSFWGSVDSFMANGVGFCVTRNDEAISACHSVLVGDGMAEVSVETKEPFRRRGFATLAASAFVERCLERGLRPVWSCWFDNRASISLAQSLGFVPREDIPVVLVTLPGGKRVQTKP